MSAAKRPIVTDISERRQDLRSRGFEAAASAQDDQRYHIERARHYKLLSTQAKSSIGEIADVALASVEQRTLQKEFEVVGVAAVYLLGISGRGSPVEGWKLIDLDHEPVKIRAVGHAQDIRSADLASGAIRVLTDNYQLYGELDDEGYTRIEPWPFMPFAEMLLVEPHDEVASTETFSVKDSIYQQTIPPNTAFAILNQVRLYPLEV